MRREGDGTRLLTNEERKPVRPKCTGKDDEKEADGEDERKKNDGCCWEWLALRVLSIKNDVLLRPAAIVASD